MKQRSALHSISYLIGSISVGLAPNAFGSLATKPIKLAACSTDRTLNRTRYPNTPIARSQKSSNIKETMQPIAMKGPKGSDVDNDAPPPLAADETATCSHPESSFAGCLLIRETTTPHKAQVAHAIKSAIASPSIPRNRPQANSSFISPPPKAKRPLKNSNARVSIKLPPPNKSAAINDSTMLTPVMGNGTLAAPINPARRETSGTMTKVAQTSQITTRTPISQLWILRLRRSTTAIATSITKNNADGIIESIKSFRRLLTASGK